MKIKVVCINNMHYPLSLKLDKEYEAKDNGDFYIIIDENLEFCQFPKEIFELQVSI
jgi:hypothetical protein